MALKHPRGPAPLSDDLSIAPLFERESRRLPRHKLPADELPPDVAYQIVHDELMLDGNARLNLATFVSTWMEPEAAQLMAECFDKNMIDKDEYPQTAELEMRCVSILSRPLARARCRQATGCSTTGSSEAAMLGGLALKRRWRRAPRRGQAGRPAEPRHGDQRPGLLGEVRELLGRRDASRADGGRPLPPLGRGGRRAVRREHDRRRRDPRLDLRRLVRARRRDLRSARRPPGAHRARHPGPRRRRLGRVRRPVRRSRPRLGLPSAAGRVDQRVGAQVRARLSRRRLDRLARRRRAARGSDLLGQLPRRQHADLRAQLLAPGCADRRAVLQLPPARVRGLPQRAVVRARRRHRALRRRSRSSARSSC